MRDKAARLPAAEVAAHTRAVDGRAAALEARRELGRSWLHVDMDVSAGWGVALIEGLRCFLGGGDGVWYCDWGGRGGSDLHSVLEGGWVGRYVDKGLSDSVPQSMLRLMSFTTNNQSSSVTTTTGVLRCC